VKSPPSLFHAGLPFDDLSETALARRSAVDARLASFPLHSFIRRSETTSDLASARRYPGHCRVRLLEPTSVWLMCAGLFCIWALHSRLRAGRLNPPAFRQCDLDMRARRYTPTPAVI
jgi:hypothetical protein